MYKLNFLYSLVFVFNICLANIKSEELWIDYDSVSKIKLGISQNELESILGEPLMVLADTEDSDNTLFLFYNYHVKRYMVDNKIRANSNDERVTLLRFTFFEDSLASWEEDNMALGMADNGLQKKSGIMNYALILINLILLLVHLHPV